MTSQNKTREKKRKYRRNIRYSSQVRFALTDEMLDHIELIAEEDDTSISAVIRGALKKGLRPVGRLARE